MADYDTHQICSLPVMDGHVDVTVEELLGAGALVSICVDDGEGIPSSASFTTEQLVEFIAALTRAQERASTLPSPSVVFFEDLPGPLFNFIRSDEQKRNLRFTTPSGGRVMLHAVKIDSDGERGLAFDAFQTDDDMTTLVMLGVVEMFLPSEYAFVEFQALNDSPEDVHLKMVLHGRGYVEQGHTSMRKRLFISAREKLARLAAESTR